MNNSGKFLFLVALSLVLAACASVDRTYGLADQIEITELTTLPAPRSAKIYRLGPQELVEISVAGAEDLSGTFLTDQSGSLNFPFVGPLSVDGLSPGEVSRLIEDRLRGDFLRDPQVSVIPAELPADSVSVGGQVLKPGAVSASGKLTLLRAVNLAGGLTEYAKLDDVLILRTVDDQNYIGLYSLGAVQRGNYPDPELFPDDIVMVGDSPERRRVDRILTIAGPLISTTAIILNQATR